MHPRSYHSHFLKPEGSIQSEGVQGLRSDSKAVEQQSRLISPSSVSINPALLQSTATAFDEDPQTVMQGQRLHVQGHQQHAEAHQRQSNSIPSPVRLVATQVSSSSASVASAEHASQELRRASELRYRRSRQTQAQSHMMSMRHHQGVRRNQYQRALPDHLPRQSVGRAIAPPGQDVSRWAAAQIRDGGPNYHLQRNPQPLRRLPLAIQPRLPSVRSAFPEIHFTD
jgi:hypothetical protein